MRQLLPLLVAAGLAPGCATSYGYFYEPAPLETHVQDADSPPVARVLITAHGGVWTTTPSRARASGRPERIGGLEAARRVLFVPVRYELARQALSRPSARA